MRILHINAIHEQKSTGRICKEMSEVARSQGHESLVAYATGPDTVLGYRIGSHADQKRHALLSRLSGKQGYFSKTATEDLIRFMESYEPDVVHLHNLHSNYLHLETLLTWLAVHDIPTVLTLHDCWFYTGKCMHYTQAGCDRWLEGCGSCPQLKEDNPSWFFDRTAEMWRDKKRWFEAIPRLAVIGVSDWITIEARFSFLQRAMILRRIYNWVDPDVFHPRDTRPTRKEIGIENTFVLLGVASSWDDSKGLADWIDLARRLPDDRVLLVGAMPNRSLPSNVHVIPATSDVEELATYYALADVFLNLSEEESFGKVTVEALASGTPAIVYDATANPELVPDRCGRVVTPHDLDALVQAVTSIRQAGGEAFREACVAHAHGTFSMLDRVSDYLNVYTQLQEMKGRDSQWRVHSSPSSFPSITDQTI
ncbi:MULTISPECIES: glycosyltransferase [Exiguobacterium]|uniref:glycosyltransferase n=1 Tax=Exiguobacterium TaxID=33986 RepID=UPI001BE7AB11|nr:MULTISPECIES: glycosyltransferase [Exiguobacterium]MCT4781657.1 glycosyltransferase [Exiguobacterium himgiriensis]